MSRVFLLVRMYAIGTKRTWYSPRGMSAFGSKADIALCVVNRSGYYSVAIEVASG
jgi:hypothetical protein